jgi:Putative secretion activating protein
MNFDQCIKFIFKHEGEYSFDPRDPGGETKYGISKRIYPSLDIKNLN